MKEFYDQCKNNYQKNAQPHLDAIARGVKNIAAARAFLLRETDYAPAYTDAMPLWTEHRDKRRLSDTPFWANYCYSKMCVSCNCRIDGSKAEEIDALFFLQKTDDHTRSPKDRTIAVHIEMKPDGDPLHPGQAEAYRPRAACYRDQRRVREGVLPHIHFVTVIFYGTGTDTSFVKRHFDRIIPHKDARGIFPGYPRE